MSHFISNQIHEKRIQSYFEYDILSERLNILEGCTFANKSDREGIILRGKGANITFEQRNNTETITLYHDEVTGKADIKDVYIFHATIGTSMNLSINLINKKYQEIQNKYQKLPSPKKNAFYGQYAILKNATTFLSSLDYISEQEAAVKSDFLIFALSFFENLSKDPRLQPDVKMPPTSSSDSQNVQREIFIKELQAYTNKRILLKADCADLFDICIATLEFLIQNHIVLRKCKLCGRYFIPTNRSDEKYCNLFNVNYPTKTCHDVYRTAITTKRINDNAAEKLSKQIYDRLNIRFKRSKDPKHGEQYHQFIKEREQFRSDIKSGNKTEGQFFEWLQEWDNKSRKRPKKQRKD